MPAVEPLASGSAVASPDHETPGGRVPILSWSDAAGSRAVPAIARRDPTQAADEAGLARDPVCGMTVDPHTTRHRREHGGRTYYFCSARCAEKFAAEPEPYLG